jgi:hypothetical protein
MTEEAKLERIDDDLYDAACMLRESAHALAEVHQASWSDGIVKALHSVEATQKLIQKRLTFMRSVLEGDNG